MPNVRELPQETILTVNMKLDVDMQEKMMQLLKDNLGSDRPALIFSITVKGISP